MNAIKNFIKHKDTEAWLWMTVNSFLVLLITYIGDINWVYAPMAIGALNLITKFINTKYLK
jgi:hypothetical protein